MKRFYVYVLYREDGTPFYVGRGTGNRWLDHEACVRKGQVKGNRSRYLIIKNIIENGYILDKRKVAEFATSLEASTYEIQLIKELGRNPNGPLVNLTDGGEGGLAGMQRSVETRAKISASHIGRPKSAEARANMSKAKRGRKQSPEVIEKRTSKLRGRPLSEDHKKKLSQSKIGRPLSTQNVEALRGKKRSVQACQNISNALKGRKLSEKSKAKLRGRKLSQSHIDAISKGNTGKKRSDDARANYRAAWIIRKEKNLAPSSV